MSPVTVGLVLLDTTYRKVLLDILRSVLLVLGCNLAVGCPGILVRNFKLLR